MPVASHHSRINQLQRGVRQRRELPLIVDNDDDVSSAATDRISYSRSFNDGPNGEASTEHSDSFSSSIRPFWFPDAGSERRLSNVEPPTTDGLGRQKMSIKRGFSSDSPPCSHSPIDQRLAAPIPLRAKKPNAQSSSPHNSKHILGADRTPSPKPEWKLKKKTSKIINMLVVGKPKRGRRGARHSLGGSFGDLLLAIAVDLKTVRQKTVESALQSATHVAGPSCSFGEETFGEDSQEQCMRRTSSMPSVVLEVNAEKLRHYNYDIKLNKLQKRALRFTWHRLQTRNGGKRVENVFEEIFDRLTKAMPIMRDMFTTRIFLSALCKTTTAASNDQQSNSSSNTTPAYMAPSAPATLREHSRLIVKMIDLVVKNLDVENDLRTDTGTEFDPMRLGRAHSSLRPYGFVSPIWEKLGETMVDVILSQEAVRDLPGAGQAWVVLTACLVDQLRAGFESARDAYNQPQPTHSQRQIANKMAANNCAVMQQSPLIQSQPFNNTTSSSSGGVAAVGTGTAATTQRQALRQQQKQLQMEEEYQVAAIAATKLLMMRARSQQQSKEQQLLLQSPQTKSLLFECHFAPADGSFERSDVGEQQHNFDNNNCFDANANQKTPVNESAATAEMSSTSTLPHNHHHRRKSSVCMNLNEHADPHRFTRLTLITPPGDNDTADSKLRRESVSDAAAVSILNNGRRSTSSGKSTPEVHRATLPENIFCDTTTSQCSSGVDIIDTQPPLFAFHKSKHQEVLQ